MKKKTGSILIFVLKTFRREGFFGVTNKYTSPQSIEFVLSNAIATRGNCAGVKRKVHEQSKLSWGVY